MSKQHQKSENLCNNGEELTGKTLPFPGTEPRTLQNWEPVCRPLSYRPILGYLGNKGCRGLTCYKKKSPPCENFGSLRHAAACCGMLLPLVLGHDSDDNCAMKRPPPPPLRKYGRRQANNGTTGSPCHSCAVPVVRHRPETCRRCAFGTPLPLPPAHNRITLHSAGQKRWSEKQWYDGVTGLGQGHCCARRGGGGYSGNDLLSPSPYLGTVVLEGRSTRHTASPATSRQPHSIALPS